jgi:hypothetical protein
LQFLRTAWASLNEARYYLHAARRLAICRKTSTPSS